MRYLVSTTSIDPYDPHHVTVAHLNEWNWSASMPPPDAKVWLWVFGVDHWVFIPGNGVPWERDEIDYYTTDVETEATAIATWRPRLRPVAPASAVERRGRRVQLLDQIRSELPPDATGPGRLAPFSALVRTFTTWYGWSPQRAQSAARSLWEADIAGAFSDWPNESEERDATRHE